MDVETTITLLYFIPGKRGKEDLREQTHTEVGLKETEHSLVGCFNDDIKAKCQETPAVFMVKRASVWGKEGERMGHDATTDFWGLDSIYLWGLPK